MFAVIDLSQEFLIQGIGRNGGVKGLNGEAWLGSQLHVKEAVICTQVDEGRQRYRGLIIVQGG